MEISKNQLTHFGEDNIKKMNHVICDRLNGTMLVNKVLQIPSNILCDSEEDEEEYGFLKKWDVDYISYNLYIRTLSMFDVNNIFKEFWGSDISGVTETGIL